jgi:hypothetical protein
MLLLILGCPGAGGRNLSHVSRLLRRARLQLVRGLLRDREASPFYFRDEIAWVEEIDKRLEKPRRVLFRTVGARAFFRPVPGLTAE